MVMPILAVLGLAITKTIVLWQGLKMVLLRGEQNKGEKDSLALRGIDFSGEQKWKEIVWLPKRLFLQKPSRLGLN
jgi:hypothetical protein